MTNRVDEASAADARRRAEFALRATLAALSGFFDIGSCCLLIVRLDWATSLAWAILGALVSVLAYGALRVFVSRRAGRCKRPEGEGEDLADKLERIAGEIEHLDDDPDPWPVRWMWNVVIVIGWAIFNVAVVVLSYPRTVVTTVAFAVLAPESTVWSAVLALVASIALQFLIVWRLVEPRAKRLGVDLGRSSAPP